VAPALRDAILAHLRTPNVGPRTAREVADALAHTAPGYSRATIGRALRQLADAGELQRLHAPPGLRPAQTIWTYAPA
jgi:Fe2+ or Zn2+ uptake regulation protein